MRKTVYCAQGFWRRAGGIVGGHTYKSCREDRARTWGARWGRHADGAIVYQMEVEPDAELKGEVIVLARYGCAP